MPMPVSPKRLSPEEEQARRDELSTLLLSAVGSQSTLDALPADYRDRVIEREVRVVAMIGDLSQTEQVAAWQSILSRATVSVDPSYGTWDPATFVVATNAVPGFGSSGDVKQTL